MAGNDINIGIKLDGAEAFAKELAESRNAVSLLASDMKLADAEFKATGNSTEYYSKKSKALSSQITAQESIVKNLEKALADSNSKFGEGSTQSQKYYKQLNSAKGKLVAMKSEQAKLPKEMTKSEKASIAFKDAIEKMADKVKEAASKMHPLQTAAKGIGEGLKGAGKLVSGAATGIVKGVSAIGAAGAAAATGVFALTTSAGTVADNLLTMSQQTGISVESLQKFQYAGQFIDTTAEDIAGAMKKTTLSMKSTSKETVAAYKKLGVATKNADGSMRNSEDVFWDTIDALGKVTNETERDQLAMTLLGKSAQDLNPLIEAGSEAYKELGDQAEQMGLIMSDETVNAFGAFDDKMNVLKSSTSAAGKTIAAEFLPQMSSIVGNATDVVSAFSGIAGGIDGSQEQMTASLSALVTNITDTISGVLPLIMDTGTGIITSLCDALGSEDNNTKMSETISTVIGDIVSFVTTNLPQVVTAGSSMLSSILDGLTGGIDTITENLPTLITNLTTAITDNLPTIVTAGSGMLTSLLDGLTTGATAITEKIPTLMTSLVTEISANSGSILSSGGSLLTSLLEGLTTVGTTLADNLPTLITSISTWINDNLASIITSGGKILWSLIAGIWQALPDILVSLGNLVVSIGSAIGDVATQALTAGGDFVASLWTGISDGCTLFWTDVSTFCSDIITNITDGVSGIGDIGKNLVEGLWNGINDKVTWVKDKVSGFCSDALGWFKGFFGIESPSKVMRDKVGKYLAQGIGVGFELEAPKQNKIMAKSASTMAKAAQMGAEISNSGNTATYNNNNSVSFAGSNFYINDQQDALALAQEISALTRQQQRGKGMRYA